jgi:hypothetical protein
MRSFHPTSLRTVGFAVLLAGGAYLGWRALDDRPPAAPDPEDSRTEQLRLDRELILACDAEVKRITEEVIARRLSLREAAVCFLAVDERLAAGRLRPGNETFPGRSPEERACRQVITCVDNTLKNRAGHAETMSRLQVELQEYLTTQSKAP